MAVKQKEVTVVEKKMWMTSDRCFTAPAVTFGNAAKQRGTGPSASAHGITVRAYSTDDVVPGLPVWSPLV